MERQQKTTPKIEKMREKLKKLVEKYNNIPSHHSKRKQKAYDELIELDWKINEEMRKL